MSRLFYPAVAIALLVFPGSGCSDDVDAPAAPSRTLAIGPAPSEADGDAGPPPTFNLGATDPPDASAEAGLELPPVDNDPGPVFGPRIWSVDDGGRLLSFRVNSAATVAVKRLTGVPVGEKIVNIDFRPANAAMYGLGLTSRIYRIDPTTGVVTAVGDGTAFTPALLGQALGFDFNPVADKIRVHTDVDQNLRLDPTTGKVAGVDGALAFAAGDVNAGQNPNLVATAYTNSVNPAPAVTMLFALDSTRNLLARLPNPNDGIVETVGELGVDFDKAAGFDVSRFGVAYAALRVGKETALYGIDLTTGSATRIGPIGYPDALTNIAVE